MGEKTGIEEINYGCEYYSKTEEECSKPTITECPECGVYLCSEHCERHECHNPLWWVIPYGKDGKPIGPKVAIPALEIDLYYAENFTEEECPYVMIGKVDPSEFN